MNRAGVLSILLTASVTATVLAQDVPYEKYELPNGLTVILHEDHSLPVASVNIWYYVGSKDEQPRRSGFAHLFEHLMFMGTQRVPGGDFDNIMEAGGGWNNATTSQDRTNYFEVGPSSLLPTLLWLEADRLEALGQNMNQEKLDKQREVVRNERRQSYENRPYGKADLRVYEMMFPAGHPYHIPVIGTHEDLVAASVDDVKNFFATYYVPANEALVVAGDFEPDDIKPLINKLFGSLPRGSEPVHRTAEPVKLNEVVRTTMSDKVQYAKVKVIYHSPRYFKAGDAEMDLIADILASGISSRLYQRLIYENELATDVSAYQSSMLLGSLFYIDVTAKDVKNLDEIERLIDEVVAGLSAKGPTQEELERHQAAIEYGAVNRLQSIMAKADMLNRYQFFFGEPNSFKRDLDRYRNATLESVQRQARATLTPDARLIMRILPEVTVPETNPRDDQPAVAAQRPFSPQVPVTYELSNGLKVHHWERHGLPLVELSLMFLGGANLDSPTTGGLASLTADMLDEGAGELGAVEFANALELLGARVNSYAGQETSVATLSSLTRNFDKALRLFADAVQHPRFDPREWERVRSLRVDELKKAQDNPSAVASVVGMRAFFGDDHPYGRPTRGTPQMVAKLKRDEASAFHKKMFRPSNAVLLLAGDLTPDQAKQYLESALGSWSDGTSRPIERQSYPESNNDRFRVVLVDKPDAVQTVIRWYMPAQNYSSPDRTKLELFGTILGGSFTSRLNQNLREEHGYTYGAGCRHVMTPQTGYFYSYSNVRADVTGESLTEFLKEFRGVRTGNVSAEEASKTRASYRTEMVQSFSNLRGILNSFQTLILNDRPMSGLADDLKESEGVTASNMNKLAYDAVPLEQALLVLVGDKKTILEKIKGLDLPEVQELTVTGDPK